MCYHTQLRDSFRKVGLDIKNIYSRDKFNVELKIYSKAVLGFAIFPAGILLRETNEAAVHFQKFLRYRKKY